MKCDFKGCEASATWRLVIKNSRKQIPLLPRGCNLHISYLQDSLRRLIIQEPINEGEG